jgi:protein TonB
LFFILILGGSFSTPVSRKSVFNVAIVAPFEIQDHPSIAKTERKKPAVKKRRPAPKKLFSESLQEEKSVQTKQKVNNPDTLKPTDKPEGSNSDNEHISASTGEHDVTSLDKDNFLLVPRSQLFDRDTIEKFARKSSPVRKGLSFDTSEFKHRGYMRMLKEKIESIWEYPDEAVRLGISGDLYLKFSITRDGRIGEIELLRTSGYRELDEAAIKAVKDAEPYWPLPEDWKKDILEIKGHFIYIFGRTYVM